MNDLRSEVAHFLGYGRGADYGETAWTTEQLNDIRTVLNSGLRQFYDPPPLEGISPVSHEWSFLRPVATLTLPEDATEINLPDDFGGFSGQVTLSGDTIRAFAIRHVGEGAIREQFALSPGRTGVPTFVAEVPVKGTSIDKGQRWKLSFFPGADQEYTIQVPYRIIPNALTSANPWVYGGEPHHETVLESCLAIAEERLDDLMNGPHSVKFRERLAASITRDRLNRPQFIGYNGDNSDARWTGLANPYWSTRTVRVTYNGLPM
jgi:hypothetical protein